jgi:hypothetical protein
LIFVWTAPYTKEHFAYASHAIDFLFNVSVYILLICVMEVAWKQ